MDCLKRLREFYTENRLDEVKFVEGQSKVSFGRGEYEFSGDIKTNFLSSINKQPYTLAQLLLYVQHWDKPHSEYAKLALKAHMPPVYTADIQVLSSHHHTCLRGQVSSMYVLQSVAMHSIISTVKVYRVSSWCRS